MEVVKRLNPTDKTRRELFLLSRNECAFPDCSRKMVDEYNHYIGKICHIEAANTGGERFNPNQTNEERRDISNLVLMCGTHHDITNNVLNYPVSVMQNIKKNHESLSLNSSTVATTNIFIDAFTDLCLSNSIEFPHNYKRLNLSECESKFFIEAKKLIEIFVNLPSSTRAFYAHALRNSYCDEIWLSFDPRELITRLHIDSQTLNNHVAILQRFNLLSDLNNEEYPLVVRYHFRGQDYEDQQIYFLYLLKKYCEDKPYVLLDMFENLNFILLDE